MVYGDEDDDTCDGDDDDDTCDGDDDDCKIEINCRNKVMKFNTKTRRQQYFWKNEIKNY